MKNVMCLKLQFSVLQLELFKCSGGVFIYSGSDYFSIFVRKLAVYHGRRKVCPFFKKYF